MTHDELGKMLRTLGKTKEGRQHFKSAIAILERLVLEDTENVEWRENLKGIKEDI